MYKKKTGLKTGFFINYLIRKKLNYRRSDFSASVWAASG